MKLLCINQSRDRVASDWLRKWVKKVPAALKANRASQPVARGRELVVVFVDSGEMRRLNRLYRGKKYATDILSFESADPGCVGELVICLPVVRSQAKRTGLGARGELGYMVVHGVLHLLGYDHLSRADEAEMFALQDRVYGWLENKVGLR